MSTWAAGLPMPLPIEVFQANSGGVVAQTASCSVSAPRGFKVLSGGGYVIGAPPDWATRDSAGFALVDSYPIAASGSVPSGWTVTAANTQDSGGQPPSVIVGAAILALYDPYDFLDVQIWSSPSAVQVGEGYYLVGGGASAVSGFLQATYPDDTCTSWNAAYGNAGGAAAAGVTAYAIGLRSKTGLGISVSASSISSSPSSTPFSTGGAASDGQFLVGAGGQITSAEDSDAYLTQCYYAFASQWGPLFAVQGVSATNVPCTGWAIGLQLAPDSPCPLLRVLPANGVLPSVEGPTINQSFRVTGGSGNYSLAGAVSGAAAPAGMQLPDGLQLSGPDGGVITLGGQVSQPSAPPAPYPYNVFIHFVVTDTVTNTSARAIYYLPVRPTSGGSAS